METLKKKTSEEHFDLHRQQRKPSPPGKTSRELWKLKLSHWSLSDFAGCLLFSDHYRLNFVFSFNYPNFYFCVFTWTRWNEERKSVFINLLHTWRKTSPPNELTLTCLLISPFEPCPSQKQRMLNSFWPKVTIYFWSEENGTQISYRPSSLTVPSTPEVHPTSQPSHPLPLAQESSPHGVMA